MTYDDNVFVLKCEVMAGMDRTELRYVTKFGTLCSSPVNAMWLESYDAAQYFKKNVMSSNFEDNNSIVPGSLVITVFQVGMYDIGLQYTLKKKPVSDPPFRITNMLRQVLRLSIMPEISGSSSI